MYFSAHVLFDSGQEPLGFLFRLLFFFSEILLNFQGCITVHLSRCFPSVSPMVFCPAAVSYRTQLLYITTAVSIRQDIFLLFLFFLFRPPEQALFPSQAVGFYCITVFQSLSRPFLIFFAIFYKMPLFKGILAKIPPLFIISRRQNILYFGSLVRRPMLFPERNCFLQVRFVFE